MRHESLLLALVFAALALPALERDIAALTDKAADLNTEITEAEHPAYRLHAKNELVAVNVQITDLENIIARTTARTLNDAAVQLRRAQVLISDRDTTRLIASALAVVEASQGKERWR